MDFEVALDMIAKRRDMHIKQATEWSDLRDYYVGTDNREQAAHASSMLNQNNFAVVVLASLLRDGEALTKGSAA